MNHRFIVGLASLGLLVSATAFGQEKIPRHVIASGGTVASAASVSVQGTLGQSIVGRSSSSSSVGSLGFWHNLVLYSPSRVDGAVTGLSVSAIEVLPHPVSTSSLVRLNVPSGREVSLRLYDALGRVRQSLLSSERIDDRPIALSADELESGTYTLVLLVDGRQTTRTIQVTH